MGRGIGESDVDETHTKGWNNPEAAESESDFFLLHNGYV